jgi:hypothetical protein
VVDHFDRFPGAADSGLTQLGAAALSWPSSSIGWSHTACVNALAVMRRLVGAYEGADVVPIVRESVERWQGADAREREQLARADLPWSLLAPDIEIRVHVLSLDMDAFRGWDGWNEYWGHWLEMWEMYTYEVKELRDLGGGTTLAQMHLRARGRGGIPVEGTTFELYRVRGALIVSWEVFQSEREAVEAARQQ